MSMLPCWASVTLIRYDHSFRAPAGHQSEEELQSRAFFIKQVIELHVIDLYLSVLS